ncbi:MAG: TetR/AcrR family transcriptional regulator [Syntrophaceticus sp.]
MKAIRPREYSDQMIFEGVSKALIKYGYSNLSLSKIAKEAQLSAAALSKRFGSKRGLLLAYYDYLTEITEQSFKAIQQTDLSALNMLKQIFLLWTNQVENPVQFANMTSIYLQNNSDPEFIEKTRHRLKIIDDEIQRILQIAIDSKEILEVDKKLLSRVLQAAVTGAFLIWCKDSSLTPEEWVNDCFDVVFAPYKIKNMH